MLIIDRPTLATRNWFFIRRGWSTRRPGKKNNCLPLKKKDIVIVIICARKNCRPARSLRIDRPGRNFAWRDHSTKHGLCSSFNCLIVSLWSSTIQTTFKKHKLSLVVPVIRVCWIIEHPLPEILRFLIPLPLIPGHFQLACKPTICPAAMTKFLGWTFQLSGIGSRLRPRPLGSSRPRTS